MIFYIVLLVVVVSAVIAFYNCNCFVCECVYVRLKPSPEATSRFHRKPTTIAQWSPAPTHKPLLKYGVCVCVLVCVNTLQTVTTKAEAILRHSTNYHLNWNIHNMQLHTNDRRVADSSQHTHTYIYHIFHTVGSEEKFRESKDHLPHIFRWNNFDSFSRYRHPFTD